jgi:hypothetical protein
MKGLPPAMFKSNRRKIGAYLKMVLGLTLLSFSYQGCSAPIRFKLEELKELPSVHDIHRGKRMLAEMKPTPKTLECHLCHGEEAAKNKKSTPSMLVCLDCHTGQQAPKLPCKRCHLGTKKIFSGVGAAEIGEMLSTMAEFDCDDCHDKEQKFAVPHDVCFDCHDKEEIKPMAQLQKEFVDKLAGVESYYKQVNNFVKSTQGKDKLLINPDEFNRGEYIYKFALMDRSKGVHNNGFVMQLISEADETLSEVSKYYDKYMQRLARDTKSGSPKVRRKALKMLKEIGDERAQDHLIQVLQNPYPATQKSAMQILGEIGGEKARNALIELLQNPNTNIRVHTVKVLGKIRGREALDALILALPDQEPKVREEIVTILGEIGGKKALKALTASLKDSNFRVRWKAEAALKKLKTSTRGKQKRKGLDFPHN